MNIDKIQSPPNPEPYIKFVEDQMCLFGEEFIESFDWETTHEDMIDADLDPKYIAWVWKYPREHAYEITVIWKESK